MNLLNRDLDTIIRRETIAEALAQLDATTTIHTWLQCGLGLSTKEAGHLLGCTRENNAAYVHYALRVFRHARGEVDGGNHCPTCGKPIRSNNAFCQNCKRERCACPFCGGPKNFWREMCQECARKIRRIGRV